MGKTLITLSGRSLRSRMAAALLLCSACAPALAGGAPECPVLPFGEPTFSQYAAGLSGNCTAEGAQAKVETPKARPTDAGPSLLKAEFSSLNSLRSASLLGSLRLDWSGLRGSEAAGSPRSERAALALGGLLRLHETLALQTQWGLEHVGAARSRAVVSSVWQPSKLAVLFAEWAGSEAGTETQRVGARWWLVPRRLAIDLGARHQPEGAGWVDQRVGVKLDLPL